jgi:3-hydroxyisobutyrate dehydrogenase-like beta-hydroxyacid dehydrogenase
MSRAPVWRCAVVGQGPMGRAVVERLAGRGVPVRVIEPHAVNDFEPRNRTVLILCLRQGTDSVRVVERLTCPEPNLVDLTTQRLATARRCAELVQERGGRYLAGGVTGGVGALVAGEAVCLLGPGPLTPQERDLLDALGPSIEFTRLEQAVGAKLLHNWQLLGVGWTLSLAIHLAAHLDIVQELGLVLDSGTAGRAPSRQSVYRDAVQEPSSSYSAALAAKDTLEICASFPGLEEIAGEDLKRWRGLFESRPDVPYTTALLDGAAELLS